jgi:Flp pilus assembly protein TadD
MQESNSPKFSVDLADMPSRPAERAEALASLRHAICEGTADSGVYGEFGQMMVQSGDLVAGERALRKAAELDPSHYNTSLADVLNRQGKSEEAIALLRQVVEDGSTDAGTHFLLGQILAQTHDISGAERAYRKALELNPSASTYRNKLVGVLSQRGMYTEAITLLQPAVIDGSADMGTYSLLGNILARSGDLPGAEQVMRKGVELNPDKPRPCVDLAQFLCQHKRSNEALPIIRKLAVSDSLDSNSYHRLGRLLLFTFDDKTGAEPLLRKAAELDRTNSEIRVTEAELMFKQKRYSHVLAVLSEFMAKRDRDERAHEMWYQAVGRLGGLYDAGMVLQKELRSNPNSSHLRDALVQVLHQQGRAAEALAVLCDTSQEQRPYTRTWLPWSRGLGTRIGWLASAAGWARRVAGALRLTDAPP